MIKKRIEEKGEIMEWGKVVRGKKGKTNRWVNENKEKEVKKGKKRGGKGLVKG